ncbi:MAG: hypothetical protein HYY67_08385 [Thaumarchaeota archaeon]|nr:hypothetical protein [Nitrososphaerota archaeon]
MKSILEQVDEFIEGLSDGSIITLFAAEDPEERFARIGRGLKLATYSDNVSELVQVQIPQYIESSNEDKEKKAWVIFKKALFLRSAGVIRNNPNNLKELDFYKAENLKLKEDLHKKGVLITELYTQLENKKVPPDKKELKF